MPQRKVQLSNNTTSEDLQLWMTQNGLIEDGVNEDGEYSVYTPLGLRLTLTMFAALLEQIGVDRDEVFDMLDPLNVSYKLKTAIVKGSVDLDGIISALVGGSHDSESE